MKIGTQVEVAIAPCFTYPEGRTFTGVVIPPTKTNYTTLAQTHGLIRIKFPSDNCPFYCETGYYNPNQIKAIERKVA